MVFFRKSIHIGVQTYNAEEFITAEELGKRISEARAMKHRLRFDLMRETNRIDKEELELFEYRLAKYMYELKAHAKLNKHIDRAEALVTKFRNQKPPENATREQVEQWEKNKLTPKKVLAVIRRYITSQNTVPRKEVALVKTSYGFKLKQYAPRLLDKVPHKAASINDLVLERTELPMPEVPTEKNMRQIRAAEKLIRRKRREYEMQDRQFPEMEEDDRLKEYLDRCAFINKDGDTNTYAYNESQLEYKVSAENSAKKNKKAVMDWILDQELNFEPDEKYMYSNSAYFLLGDIIEQVSETSYEKYIKENILKPSGMMNTGFEGTDKLAVGYQDIYDNAWTLYPGVGYSATSLISNVPDLLKLRLRLCCVKRQQYDFSHRKNRQV